jgi:protein arginine kinase activator
MPPSPSEPTILLPAPSCPTCGYTVIDLQRTGRLGCACCYQSFAPLIAPQLPLMHRGTRHHGKVPHGHRSAYHRALLREALARAIATEDYEQAAVLRDQLA